MNISVVIPTYNRVKILSKTLLSLNSQICDFDFEVLVCDDGSDDGTYLMVESYINKANFSLHYLRQERNKPRYSAIRNLGIRNACGQIILLLDDDMIVPPTFIDAHFASHKTSNIVTVGYRYNLVPGENQTCTPDVREKHFVAYPNIDVPVWSVLETCNVSVERDLLFQVGLFDETFTGWGGEDIELGYRLYKFGTVLVLNKEIYAWHQYDPDPKNSFFRYHQGLKPDFSSQLTNLQRFRNKYTEDGELQDLLTNWIKRLQKIDHDMVDGTY